MKLRLVRSPEEEAMISKKMDEEAHALLNALITQVICFKRLKEYALISQMYKQYKENNNAEVFLASLEKMRFLFKLGTPSEKDIKSTKMALAQIQLLGDTKFETEEHKIESNQLAKLIFRGALFKQHMELDKLNHIASEYRAYHNIANLKKVTAPLMYILKLS